MTIAGLHLAASADVCTPAGQNSIRASVTVRTPERRVTYPAIGSSSSAIHAAALELFGGLCSVVVIPTREANHGN